MRDKVIHAVRDAPRSLCGYDVYGGEARSFNGSLTRRLRWVGLRTFRQMEGDAELCERCSDAMVKLPRPRAGMKRRDLAPRKESG